MLEKSSVAAKKFKVIKIPEICQGGAETITETTRGHLEDKITTLQSSLRICIVSGSGMRGEGVSNDPSSF